MQEVVGLVYAILFWIQIGRVESRMQLNANHVAVTTTPRKKGSINGQLVYTAERQRAQGGFYISYAIVLLLLLLCDLAKCEAKGSQRW